MSAVRHIENLWIPLADGTRLAARAWIPANAEHQPVPALLEFLPYRKRDFMRARDEPMHRWFAEHGYASLRVDLRGSGDSDGLLDDEYTAREHQDGVKVIDWIARQDWCDGAVGMFGISWGGFNALQIAALRPPALKAVISLCASDDRYTDDAHYMGGCLLTENLQWGAIFMLNQALPADPALVGDGWRAQWRERLEHLPNFAAEWMRHPWRDDYWKHGSVCEDIGRIEVPVYAMGGWADAYSNAVPRILASLKSPSKGLVGPWAHTFPHLGVPGPAIGFLDEARRWWDRWLKGEHNGIDDEPRYRAWMQEAIRPAPNYADIPGRWVAETDWPSARISTATLHLAADGLRPEPGPPRERTIASPEICGLRAGEWCAFGSDGEMPRDQRPDDGFSLCFDSPPLEGRVEILGAPRVRLELVSDQPQANLCVRLCDVAPDGASLRVTYGLLNLANREGHESPQPLTPGEPFTVEIALNDIAHAFPAGHRIRLALSTAYWPIAWPSPAPVSLGLRTGHSTLSLPVRPPHEEDARLREFEAPAMADAPTAKRLRSHDFRRRLLVDLAANTYHYELNGSEFDDASLVHFEDIDLKVGYTLNKGFDIADDDPLSARHVMEQRAVLARGDWRVTVRLTLRLESDAEFFHLTGELEADEGGEPFVRRQWDERIPRRCL